MSHKRERWEHLTDEQFEELCNSYPYDELVEISDSICECEEWIVGEHRCFCGNRRIDLYFDNLCNFFVVEAY